MIPSIVKTPVFLAQQLTLGIVRVGASGAAALLHRVLPGEGGNDREEPPSGSADVVDITPPKPSVDAEPVRQPSAPEHTPTPGATTTLADPAPATANPATRATAKRATARPGPAKKATAKKASPSATAAQRVVAKKTPATKSAPTKPAATLNEPAAPVDDDPVVFSSGPDA